MTTVTALRPRGRRVAVELDGASWRTLPIDVVLEASLRVGCELNRERARAIARARRRHRAMEISLRFLERRDRSRVELDATLERAAVREPDRRDALERASAAGLLDDVRFATSRAQMLAARGAGDRLLADDLRRHGIDLETMQTALADVEPEAARAARIVTKRGRSARTLRYLAARGFSEESLEELIAELEDSALP